MILHLISMLFLVYFFFSSRRRHTRWPRDWSSDVCSSDLFGDITAVSGPVQRGHGGDVPELVGLHLPQQGAHAGAIQLEHAEGEIGRAARRGRGQREGRDGARRGVEESTRGAGEADTREED